MGIFTIAGVLEGFYGKPWSWAQRRAVMEHCVPAGLPWYAWAPKGDPLHRAEWREPFGQVELDGFADLLTIPGLRLCIALSPGIEPGEVEDDAAAIVEKLAPVISLVEAAAGGDPYTPLIMLAFDDLAPVDPDEDQLSVDDRARQHGQMVAAVAMALEGRAQFAVIPAHYAGVEPTDYLQTLSAELPPDVLVGWTGRLVVNERIDAVEAEAFADAVDGRALLLWDNYPVNDALLKSRLFLHPLQQRDSYLSEFCPAYFANAGVQPHLSLPALLSAGVFCETGESGEVWDEFDEPVQLALLAEACEGVELFRLAQLATVGGDPKALDDLWWWLERLEVLELSGPMGEESKPWTDQISQEAQVCLIAVDLLEREADDPEVPALVTDLLVRWPLVRRSKVSVFGPRFEATPQLTVDRTGAWKVVGNPIQRDRNATDVLCVGAIELHSL